MAVFLCKTATVTADSPVRVVLSSGLAVSVFQIDEDYYVTDDLCTHGKASLSDGFVENGEVECPYHQGRFDIRTGKATAAPCVYGLNIHAVLIQDSGIYIED